MHVHLPLLAALRLVLRSNLRNAHACDMMVVAARFLCVTGLSLMMSVHALAPVPARSDDRWAWLAAAADMAANTCAAMPPHVAGGQGRYPVCFPRVASRTPVTDPASVPMAREFTRCTLQRWGRPGHCDDIATVMSELVTNAIRYGVPSSSGGWPIRFGLLQAGPGSGVLCAVADSNPDPPMLKPLNNPAESGRGLHVVQGLSNSWGYAATGESSKVVWAMFTPSSR
jgi:hypothetical protein